MINSSKIRIMLYISWYGLKGLAQQTFVINKEAFSETFKMAEE